MSTITHPTTQSSVAQPSLPTLITVELRKLYDTPAMITALLTAAFLALGTGFGQTLRDGPTTFGHVTAMAMLFTPYVVVAVSAALVVGERTHRTCLSTYALVPRRTRVLTAKAGAVVTLALCFGLFTLLVGAFVTAVAPLAGVGAVDWTIEPARLAVLAGGLVLTALLGWALALATGSLVVTVAVFLVWPVASLVIGGFSPAAARVLEWVAPDAVYTLQQGVTATSLGHTGVSVTLWIILPALAGWARLTKGEIR